MEEAKNTLLYMSYICICYPALPSLLENEETLDKIIHTYTLFGICSICLHLPMFEMNRLEVGGTQIKGHLSPNKI